MQFLAGLTTSLARETDKSVDNMCETQFKEGIINGILQSCCFAMSLATQPPTGQFDYPVLIPLRVEGLGQPGRRSLLFNCLPYGLDVGLCAWEIATEDSQAKDSILTICPLPHLVI